MSRFPSATAATNPHTAASGFSWAPPEDVSINQVVWSNSSRIDAQMVAHNAVVHETMLGQSVGSSLMFSPVFYIDIRWPELAATDNSSGSFSAYALQIYGRLEEQLQNLPQEDLLEDAVERGAVESALSVLNELRRCRLAPPMLSWHGGDAVVMLWALGNTTCAITVSEGELGLVIRRDRKTVRIEDSIAIDEFKLENAGRTCLFLR